VAVCSFVCGFPTQNGDGYGGSIYCSSLDASAQGAAIKAAELKWGASGLPLCKYKYQPFRQDGSASFGCHLHHAVRLKRIQKHGVRPDWEDFEQWPPPPRPKKERSESGAGGK
jgi:hypothetical protein